jgi:hypothetical protein
MQLRQPRVALVVCACLGLHASAVTVDLSTVNTANWKVTGAGAVDAPAWQWNVTGVALTSNQTKSGTFATGGSLANFNGFWFANEKFTLPANAANVKLAFSTLLADDRVVLQLNGASIGDFFLNVSGSNPPSTGLGVMSLPPGPPDQPFTFTGQTTGTVTSGFVIGGENVLRLVMNNTHQPALNSPTVTYQDANDGSSATVTATLTYDVPEPGSACLIAVGCIAGLFPRSKRQRLKHHR